MSDTNIMQGATAAGTSDPLSTVGQSDFAQVQQAPTPGYNWGQAAGTVGSLASLGGEVGGGWGAAIGAVVGVGVDLVSYFSGQSDLASADAKAQAYDAQARQDALNQNAITNNQNQQRLDQASATNAFNMRQGTAQNVTGVNNDLVQKLTGVINNNDSLKQAIITRAGGK